MENRVVLVAICIPQRPFFRFNELATIHFLHTIVTKRYIEKKDISFVIRMIVQHLIVTCDVIRGQYKYIEG